MDDIQAMLCADGLAISRSTLHFLTFAHTRAKHHFVPSECGPGTYTRKSRKKLDGTKKPNPNNTTLLCIEKPDAEVRLEVGMRDRSSDASTMMPEKVALIVEIVLFFCDSDVDGTAGAVAPSLRERKHFF